MFRDNVVPVNYIFRFNSCRFSTSLNICLELQNMYKKKILSSFLQIMIVCFPSTIRQILNLFIRTGLMPNSLTRGTQWSGVRIEACLSLSHRDTRGVRKNCQISAPSPNHVGKERGKVLKTVETSRRNVGKSSYLEKLSLPLFQLTTSISFVNDSQTILSLPTSLDPSLCMALSTTLGIKSH